MRTSMQLAAQDPSCARTLALLGAAELADGLQRATAHAQHVLDRIPVHLVAGHRLVVAQAAGEEAVAALGAHLARPLVVPTP